MRPTNRALSNSRRTTRAESSIRTKLTTRGGVGSGARNVSHHVMATTRARRGGVKACGHASVGLVLALLVAHWFGRRGTRVYGKTPGNITMRTATILRRVVLNVNAT